MTSTELYLNEQARALAQVLDIKAPVVEEVRFVGKDKYGRIVTVPTDDETGIRLENTCTRFLDFHAERDRLLIPKTSRIKEKGAKGIYLTRDLTRGEEEVLLVRGMRYTERQKHGNVIGRIRSLMGLSGDSAENHTYYSMTPAGIDLDAFVLAYESSDLPEKDDLPAFLPLIKEAAMRDNGARFARMEEIQRKYPALRYGKAMRDFISDHEAASEEDRAAWRRYAEVHKYD